MIDKQQTPGCYKMPIVFNSNSTQCRHCKVRVECQESSQSQLEALNIEMDVSDLLNTHHKRFAKKTFPQGRTGVRYAKQLPVTNLQLTREQDRVVKSMPKKAAQVVEQIHKRDIDLHESLRKKVNPFSHEKPAFMAIPCDRLLENGFTRKQLCEEYMKAFPHWKKETAKRWVSVAISVFKGLNMVNYTDERGYQLK